MEIKSLTAPPHSYHHPHQIKHADYYLGIIVFLIALNFVFVGYLADGYNKLNKKIDRHARSPDPVSVGKPPFPTIQPSPPPSPSPSPSVTLVVDNPKTASVDITLYTDPDDKTKFVASFPKGTKLSSVSSVYSLINQNGSVFRVVANRASEGPCPLIPDDTNCTFSTESLGPIPIFRVWQDNRGIFMLNPQSITIGDSFISNLLITKEKPNLIFTPAEIKSWKDSLKSIKIVLP